MTREMKIGLLLSLGIVIVVFVLLSDQVVSTDARPARVTDAGPQVHEGIATPGGASPAMAGPIQIEDVEPTQPVAVVQEMTPRPAPSGVAVVDIGPAPAGAVQTIGPANNNVQTNARVTLDTGNPLPSTLVTPLEPMRVVPLPMPSADAAAPRVQEYKAVAGDTVARMARKFYGSDQKANRDLIINANKAALKADPSKVVVGKVYLIPSKTPAPAPAAVAAAPTTRPAAEVASAVVPSPTTLIGTTANRPEPAPAERIYVVKSGDNLWKIAKEQCKSSNAVDEIKKLNRAQLKNGSDLTIGMKLKLPPVM